MVWTQRVVSIWRVRKYKGFITSQNINIKRKEKTEVVSNQEADCALNTLKVFGWNNPLKADAHCKCSGKYSEPRNGFPFEEGFALITFLSKFQNLFLRVHEI